jgi:uncharacterized membrane protein
MRQPTPATPHLPQPRHHTFLGRVLAGLRNNFIAGVVVIAPIGLTVWLIWTAVGWVDSFVWPFVPRYYHPDVAINRWLGNAPGTEGWIDIDVRGVGVVVFLVFTVLVGWIAKGLVGRSLLRAGEDVLGRVPVVRPVYNGLKQIAETVFAQSEAKFDQIVLVEFPRKGLWSIAFVSTTPRGEIGRRLRDATGEEIIALFRPMTPNLTAGFLMFTRRSEVIPLNLTLEEAAKIIISAGLVHPAEAGFAEAGPAGVLGPGLAEAEIGGRPVTLTPVDR